MRKGLIGILLILLICFLCVSVSAQEQHEDHCVCGGAAVGVGDHTQCDNITWQPLSQALKAIGQTMEAADFGFLPSGYYYLDGDVTVTKASAIGYKKDSLATEPDDVANLYFCLNGHSINATTTKAFGYLNKCSSLSICDCSYENGTFKGYVNGGKTAYGSVIYTYTDSLLTIYGGNFTGKGTTNGGAFVIACDGCGDVDGNGKYESADRYKAQPAVMKVYNGHISGSSVSATGGTIQLFHTAQMYMYGGTIVGGTAKTSGGTIGLSSKAYVFGGTMIGGVSAGKQDLVQVIKNDGQVVGIYTSFADGLKKAENTADCYMQLVNDVQATDTVSGTLYLDLNGFTLSGIKITGTLYGMDSTTKAYDGSKAGRLLPASGTPVQYHKTTDSQVGGIYRYLTVQDESGYSFHRFYMAVTEISVKPSTTGVGYKATVIGNEEIRQQLSTAGGYGYSLWLDPANKITRGFPAEKLEGTQKMTLRINNYLSTQKTAAENTTRGEQKVYASVYLRLKDGTRIETEPVAYSFRDMLEMADARYESFNTSQKTALADVSKRFSAAMIGWDISNTHHVRGGMWTSVDAAGFKAKLSVYKTYTSGLVIYNIASGHYALTEDVDLGNGRIRIQTGQTVSICLNGHNFKSSNSMFAPYGALNICDCHKNGHEGTVLSSYSGESAHYAAIAYCRCNSVTNIYGGNFVATGKVTSAGMFAVSHDGPSTPDAPPAVMNMYGGTISGGSVYTNGGLICVWNDGTFNMYGGELYGGTAEGRGGGIDVNNGILNIQGGKIYNCTSGTNGGAINCSTNADLVNIENCTITGNTAPNGGGVYLYNNSATVGGTTVIKDNVGGNLYCNGSTINADGLTQGAEVAIQNSSMMPIGTNEEIVQYITCDSAYKPVYAYGKVVLMANDLSPVGAVTGFQVGFGESDITPEVIDGMPLAGYSNSANRPAKSEGMKEYDRIKAQCVAVTDENGTTVILIYCDLITCSKSFAKSVTSVVSAATGVPEENVLLNCSHSHSVPSTATTSVDLVVEYNKTLPDLFARAALQAMHDRQPATMETGSFEVEKTVHGKTQYYNFYRHYTTEVDGVLQYFGDQFGYAVYNETTQPIRDADHTMHLVKFTRDGKDILMANWRIHPHFTGGESKYLMSADAIGTIRYYMAQKLPDAHFIYFQGASGNMNESSRLTSARNKTYGSQVQHHGLGYVKYGETIAGIIVDNLSCLSSVETGIVQVEHYDYLAKVDTPSEEEYTTAKEFYDNVFAEATEGMTLSERNAWLKAYRDEHPEITYVSGSQIGFILNRRATEKDAYLPLNVVTIGDSFGLFTAPGELWDSISMAVEDQTNLKTVFCLGYSMAHYHYFVYYPEYADQPNGMPYQSYEGENRHFVAPTTVEDMIAYWTEALNRLAENAK